jgi:hypothetical protein
MAGRSNLQLNMGYEPQRGGAPYTSQSFWPCQRRDKVKHPNSIRPVSNPRSSTRKGSVVSFDHQVPCHHRHHLQGLSLSARSVVKHEASLRIMSNSFLLEQVISLLQNSLPWRTRVFIRGFLPSQRLSTMANESRLPVTSPWEEAHSRYYPPGHWDLELA